jgi:hypothetical protein
MTAAVLLSSDARAQSVEECSRAYEEAQERRQEKRLLEARKRLLVCVQDACPAAARADCSRWLAEVDAGTPTVVLEVIGRDGRQVLDARVALDGMPFAGGLDGVAAAVDPGPHTFRFEVAGEVPVERRVVVLEGQKNVKVSASYAPRAAPTTTVTVPPPGGYVEERPTPVAVWVLGGVGALALGSFAFFGISAVTQEDDLSECDPRNNPKDPVGCSEEDLDEVLRNRIVADVSLGVGIVALGAATVVYLTRPTIRSATPARPAGLRVTPRGAALAWKF